MDKFLIRKDVYGELIEKGYGKKDLSKLTKKKITDKNGHTRTVYVRNGEQPATQQQPKAQDELSPEKKARYEEMLKQVMSGPEENALFVRGKGMLNKKDAVAHLSGKLGVKISNQSADDFLHGNQPTPGSMMKEQQQKIMKDNDNQVVIKRKYGMISLYGAKTGDHIADFPTEKARLDFMKENNLSKPDENATTPDIKGGEKTIERYKEVNESGNKNKKEYSKNESLKDKLTEMKNNGEEYIEAELMKEPIDNVIKFVNEVEKQGYGMTPFVGLSKYMEKNGYDVNNAGGVFIVKPKPKETGNGKTLTDDLMDMKNNGETYIVNKYMKVPIDDVIKLSKEIDKDGYTMTPFVGTSEYFKEKGYRVQNAGGVFVIKKPELNEKKDNKNKNSVNGFTLDDIYHHGSDKKWDEVKKIDNMETAKGVVEMIAQKYGATDKGREQLMDFIAYNIGGTNPLYDKLYEEYGVDADDLDMDFEASHDLILNQAMGKDTKKNREQIADSKSDFERRYRQMLEREG